MATKLDTSRRSFLVGSAAGVGGLMLGLHVPLAGSGPGRGRDSRSSMSGSWSMPTIPW